MFSTNVSELQFLLTCKITHFNVLRKLIIFPGARVISEDNFNQRVGSSTAHTNKCTLLLIQKYQSQFVMFH